MSEGKKFEVVLGGINEKEKTKDALKEEMDNVLAGLRTVIIQVDEEELNLQGLEIILRKIDRLKAKVETSGRTDLILKLDRVQSIVSDAVALETLGYNGKAEQVASYRQQLLMAIEE